MRVSSNDEDQDPQNLSFKLVQNKFDHLGFKPEIFNSKTIKRIKRLIDQGQGGGSPKTD